MLSLPHDMTDVPPPPEPGTYYLQFQRQLAATEQIDMLGKMLAHVHFLYEGWGPVALREWQHSELKRIYTKAACWAVRFCSEVERKVALGKAERWALDNYLRLRMAQLKTGPGDHEAAEKLLRDFVRGIVDEYRFCLMHGCTALSPADKIQVAEMEASDDDPRRI